MHGAMARKIGTRQIWARPIWAAALCGAGLMALGTASGAAAQDGCPPGMTRIGSPGAFGANTECVPMYDSGGGGAPDTITADELAASYAPRPDRETRVLSDVINEMRARIAEVNAAYGRTVTPPTTTPRTTPPAASSTPVPAAAPARGQWRVFQNGGNAVPPGQFCTAVYSNPNGMVVLSGPSPNYRGALLQFVGPNIPTGAANVVVTLEQTGDARPQTVRAYRYTMPDVPYGILTLAAPSIGAALDGMLDEQFLRARVNGQMVMDITWHGADGARERMRGCLRGERPPEVSAR